MDSVGVREMRQHLSRFLDRVSDGESFEITDRGRLVARLVPASPASDDLARLVERYGVVPPARATTQFPKALRAPAGTPSSAELLADLRSDRL